MANALNDRADRNALASGTVAAAAVILLLAGVLDLLRGIMAIAKDEIFARTPNYTFRFDATAWGWIHLALGALALLAGLALFRLALWARITGVVMACLLIVANFLSIPYYPLWSIIVMAACVFVVWGLCAVRR